MPRISRTIFLAALLFGWGIPFSIFSFHKKETPIQASILVPTISLDLSDLDVRDSLNQKVKSPAAREQLKSLFVNGLTTLLVFNMTPGAKMVADMLAKSWNIFSRWFGTASQHVFNSVVAWFQSKKSQIKIVTSSIGGALIYPRESVGRNLSFTPDFATLASSIISSTRILR